MGRNLNNEALGPIGRRSILVLAHAARVVAVVHPIAGRMELLHPTGIGWANVWFKHPSPEPN